VAEEVTELCIGLSRTSGRGNKHNPTRSGTTKVSYDDKDQGQNDANLLYQGLSCASDSNTYTSPGQLGGT
jgi:hypothetical protein